MMKWNVTMGCIALGPRAIGMADRVVSISRHGDLMSDFVPELPRKKSKVAAYYNTASWHDIGTLASYERINSELRDRTLPFLESAGR